MGRRRIDALLALGLVTGCSHAHTALVLHFASEDGVPIQRVHVTVAREGDAVPEVDRTYVPGQGGVTLPGTLAIVPRDARDTREVLVHVDAVVTDGADITRDLVTHFVADSTVDLDIVLSTRCSTGQGCDAGTPDVDCGADAGTRDLRADLDTADNAPFDRVDAPDAACVSTVTSPTRNGQGAARFVVAPGDRVGARERCTIDDDASGEHEGSSFYYAWSVYLPTGFDASAGDVTVAGWTGRLEPVVSLAVMTTDAFALRFRSGFVDTTAMTIERTRDEALGVDAVTGVWHDFVLHVGFSQSDSDGHAVVWHRIGDGTDFAQVLDVAEDTLQHDRSNVVPTAFFLGTDRAPAGAVQTVLLDRVRRGTSFASVAYDGCGM